MFTILAYSFYLVLGRKDKRRNNGEHLNKDCAARTKEHCTMENSNTNAPNLAAEFFRGEEVKERVTGIKENLKIQARQTPIEGVMEKMDLGEEKTTDQSSDSLSCDGVKGPMSDRGISVMRNTISDLEDVGSASQIIANAGMAAHTQTIQQTKQSLRNTEFVDGTMEQVASNVVTRNQSVDSEQTIRGTEQKAENISKCNQSVGNYRSTLESKETDEDKLSTNLKINATVERKRKAEQSVQKTEQNCKNTKEACQSVINKGDGVLELNQEIDSSKHIVQNDLLEGSKSNQVVTNEARNNQDLSQRIKDSVQKHEAGSSSNQTVQNIAGQCGKFVQEIGNTVQICGGIQSASQNVTNTSRGSPANQVIGDTSQTVRNANSASQVVGNTDALKFMKFSKHFPQN